MRKLICATGTVLLVCAAALPAQANANKHQGRVDLSVRGSGLRVDRVSGVLDGDPSGVRAQLYAFVGTGPLYNVTSWKNATRQRWGINRVSTVDWEWKGGRTFPPGTRLCIVFNRAPGDNPCAVIHI